MLNAVPLSKRRSVLLVDDDEIMVQSLSNLLVETGEFDALIAATAQAATKTTACGGIDAVLIDASLSDVWGPQLCRMMRRSGIYCPIIMLSAVNSEAEAILCFESGASDYVTKPFRFAVLLARLRAHLRSYELTNEFATFAIGRSRFVPAIRKIFLSDGSEVSFTEKESAILKLLCRMRGHRVEREAMLRAIWGLGNGLCTHKVETHIHRLRQKLEADPEVAVMLVTEPGGYRLQSASSC